MRGERECESYLKTMEGKVLFNEFSDHLFRFFKCANDELLVMYFPGAICIGKLLHILVVTLDPLPIGRPVSSIYPETARGTRLNYKSCIKF